jgi:hypothetical protein
MRYASLTAITVVVAAFSTSADDNPAPKRIESGKNVVLEIPAKAGEPRRVRIAAEVVFREGPLELFMCRKNTKEHESVVAADVDARDIHKALLAAGAKVGSPVKFVPKYEPAKGSKILVSIEYTKDKKTITVPARQWVRDAKTRKELSTDWVFGGSQFFPDPDGKDKPPLYAANGGDVICVSNFESAMLDLPIQSTQLDAELQFEAFTDRIPPLGTKVTIILEPAPEKK